MSSNPFIDNLPSPGREMAQLIAEKTGFLEADTQTTVNRLANSTLVLLGYLVSNDEPSILATNTLKMFDDLRLDAEKLGLGYTQIRSALRTAITNEFINLSGYTWIMDGK